MICSRCNAKISISKPNDLSTYSQIKTKLYVVTDSEDTDQIKSHIVEIYCPNCGTSVPLTLDLFVERNEEYYEKKEFDK